MTDDLARAVDRAAAALEALAVEARRTNDLAEQRAKSVPDFRSILSLVSGANKP